MSLEEQLEALSCGFMSIVDYAEAERSGKLPKWPDISSESLSKVKYPKKHPLNDDIVDKRSTASVMIWMSAQEKRHLFTRDVLEKIHVHMFDCSPAVRLWLVQALYYIGDRSSVPHIKRLLDMEVIGDLPNTVGDISEGMVILCKLAPKPASCERTIFLLSPDFELAKKLRDFSEHKDMNLWIGGPDSPDVIAVPYKVGIVYKNWMDEKAWNEWIIFLKESHGEGHDFLLIIIVNSDTSEWERRELEAQFVDTHRTIFFVSEGEKTNILRTVKIWLDSNPPIQQEILPSEEVSNRLPSQNTGGDKNLQHRVRELLHRFSGNESAATVNLQAYFKWRTQAKSLLIKYLGDDHHVVKDLDSAIGLNMNPPVVGDSILAAKGILEALLEDLDQGLFNIMEKQ